MNIPADHPDADSPLLTAVSETFVSMGAVVSVLQTGDNLVRVIPASAAVAAIAVVQAQGLPNLIHELVHTLHAGRLADDHGIDYTGIPFDLATEAGRALLWEELSCSLLSCAYLGGELTRCGLAATDRADRVDAWFVEQVEIQPVFYGMEDAPAAFFARVGTLLRAHSTEADAVVAVAVSRMRAALQTHGALAEIAHVDVEPLEVIWGRVMGPRAQSGRSA